MARWREVSFTRVANDFRISERCVLERVCGPTLTGPRFTGLTEYRFWSDYWLERCP